MQSRPQTEPPAGLSDPYYPPEKASERAGMPLPLRAWPSPTGAVVEAASGARGEVALGREVDGWRLLSGTRAPRAAVLERRFRRWGMLVYVGDAGASLTVRLPIGELSAIADDPPPAHMVDAESILAAEEDVPGERVLAAGEPCYQAAAAMLPELVGYVPVSSGAAERKRVIDERGRVGYLRAEYGGDRLQEVLLDPAAYVGGLAPTAARRGLLEGHLPAVHYAFWDAAADDGWEEIAFSLSGAPEVTFVALVHRGAWRAFVLDPLREVEDLSELFEALAAFCGHWKRELAPSMSVDLPEPRLCDASLAALARAFTTFVGDHPRYGLGTYADPVHDGFPPTTLWMVNACLEWGLFDRAERHLSHYFDRFVREDGSFDYYGPAVSEYGQMLDLVARYVRYTDDQGWLAQHGPKVEAIAQLLLALRRESLAQPEGAVTRGLLYGSPEADTREETEYYLSGSAWAWRGLVESSRLPGEEQIIRECDALRADILRAARASLIAGDPPFLPPYPGLGSPFESMTESGLASYTNYRYWPELLSAEVLEGDLAEAVFEFRRQRGGELMGTTRFAGQLDDWPFANHSRALLAADRADQYLLGLYGHLAAHQMPGTFCSYEQVAIRGEETRSYVADYCVPAQLTIPLLVRWMLVYEERDQEVLWLCKTVPRRWFAPGQEFSVRNAPTRWGPVSFRVQAGEDEVEIEVTPSRRVAGLVVRVRRPGGETPSAASANGVPVPFSAAEDTLVLRDAAGPVHVHLRYDSEPT